MPLHTTVAKALAQIERRDTQGVRQYRAELKYFHVPQRVILGATTAYAVADEAYTIPDALQKLNILNEPFRRAFANGAEGTDWTAQYVRDHYPSDGS